MQAEVATWAEAKLKLFRTERGPCELRKAGVIAGHNQLNPPREAAGRVSGMMSPTRALSISAEKMAGLQSRGQTFTLAG